MRLAIAQIKSSPGDIAINISKHLEAIDLAVMNGAKLIGFPELSLTGYEPTLAEALAFDISDQRLKVFETRSTELGISIGVGLPTKSDLLVIMCNAVGPSDDFLSSGQSATWDEQGNLLAMSDPKQIYIHLANQGFHGNTGSTSIPNQNPNQ